MAISSRIRGWLEPTVLTDVRLQVLAGAPRPLAHNVALEFYSGATQIPVRTRVLGSQGDYAW